MRTLLAWLVHSCETWCLNLRAGGHVSRLISVPPRSPHFPVGFGRSLVCFRGCLEVAELAMNTRAASRLLGASNDTSTHQNDKHIFAGYLEVLEACAHV